MAYILGVVQNCHHFHKVHRGRWKEGVNGRYALLKNVDYDALHFHTSMRSLKATFSKYSFGREGGRGSQKEYSVYAFDNVDNPG